VLGGGVGSAVLGIATLVPSFAKADGFHDARRGDRDDNNHVQLRVDVRDDHRDGRWDRDDHGWRDGDHGRVVVVRPAPVYVPARVYVPPPQPMVVVALAPVCVTLPNVDYNVAIGSVPPTVMETVQCEQRGAPIESVQFVRRDGEEFYRFMLSAGFGRHLDMRITLGGKLLGIDPC